jgi:hypothetical protein
MKNPIVRIVNASYVRDYEIRLTFADGDVKVVDFSRWLHGEVFKSLRDKRAFKRFFVAGGTVCWPNGADIAPETLKSVATPQQEVARPNSPLKLSNRRRRAQG